jgi:hypothetical protein
MEVGAAQIATSRRPRESQFTAEEDAVIMKARLESHPESWMDIAKRLEWPTSTECRNRWKRYLSPEISPEPWTPEEDRFLVEKINELGTAWRAIRPSFEGRSTIDLSNRWRRHLKSKTVRDGAKFIYTDSDPNFADPNRNERKRHTTRPKEVALAIVQEEVAQTLPGRSA